MADTNHKLPGYVLSLINPSSDPDYCTSTAYACTTGGYSPSSVDEGQLWYDAYGPGQASEGSNDLLHNCTMYAAFKLAQNGYQIPTSGPDAPVLGNASDWARQAAVLPGVTVDQTPDVGAIAQWNAGHVGYVEQVTASYIVVTSDSFVYEAGHTSRYRIPDGSPGWPDNFIHFPLKQGAASSELTPAQTAGLAYADHIVHWSGDTKPQKTAWYVEMTIVPPLIVPVPTRHWIPDIQTYWCLVNQDHAPQPPTVLPASVLSTEIPDDIGSWASCDTPTGGQGSDGVSPTAGIAEQAGQFGAPTLSDYHSASGAGPRIAPGALVSVACKVLDPTIASADPDGYWYQIESSPWNGAYYAPANVFMNGDPWNGPYTHNTDFSVPDCGSGAGPSQGGGTDATGIGTWLEQEGHNGAPTFTTYHSASGPGPAISAGEYVHVACKVLDGTIPSSNPDGYWYLLADPPWSDQYYAAANTFMNGDPWNGPYTHNTDFDVPDCGQAATTKTGAAPSGAPPGETTYAEQEGHNGVQTFTDYHNASGRGVDIAPAATVQVSCKVLDGTVASVNPDGYWYRIASSPWSDGYYAPANTFMNGDPWNGPYTHNTDFNVPDCANATPTPPPPTPVPDTVAETVGGVTHTWTDYEDAGGTEGSSIQIGQTVQITCRVQGFAVADKNTWWYQVASSPWNNTYYASADAFYNNGATSGSLLGTPFYDGAVPVCGSSTAGGGPSPQTWAETVGPGGANTWTDYSDAGGTEGAHIPEYDTVQITCRLQGFQVPDTNTWWYQIASSPWSNEFYVSADAFYNNGETSGNLQGTPFYDPAVPVC